jgi:hypothetical protein
MGQVQEVVRQRNQHLLRPSSKHLHLKPQLHLTYPLMKFSPCQHCLQQWYDLCLRSKEFEAFELRRLKDRILSLEPKCKFTE